MLRVGLIGCGGIGAVHMECWRSMPDEVQLVAIADTDVSKIEKYANLCQAYAIICKRLCAK